MLKYNLSAKYIIIVCLIYDLENNKLHIYIVNTYFICIVCVEYFTMINYTLSNFMPFFLL